ncbi:MAG TPA: UDP-N-acetylmuramate dehydrogenase [Phnomibacter sp.]|nr:UDP-N-acetylmuramate dehydrogenase [Phnomibacter sp.]
MMEFDYNLQPLTTFNVPAPVAAFSRFQSVEGLLEILHEAKPLPLYNNLLLLGGGSNMLFTKKFEGLVLKNECKGIELVQEDENYFYVKVGGGENWHQLVMHCVQQQWAGIENLALIPGCVGAAPIQNIGAYGVELKDVFHSLEALHLYDHSTITFDHAACTFGYRDSVFKHAYKNQLAILSVTLKLAKTPRLRTSYGAIEQELQKMGSLQPGIAEVSQAVINIRRSKLPDPAVVGNAGSFFKNPVIAAAHYQELKRSFPTIPGFAVANEQVKVPAAWLIEQCGWKGYREGDAGVNALQPLVLVNFGKATGSQVFELSGRIIESVAARFAIQFEREVNIF